MTNQIQVPPPGSIFSQAFESSRPGGATMPTAGEKGKHLNRALFAVIVAAHAAVVLLLSLLTFAPAQKVAEPVQTIDLTEVVYRDVAPVPPPKSDLPPPPVLQADPETSAASSAAVVNVAPPAESAPAQSEPEYLPPFKINQVPDIPAQELISRIVYPPLASKQGIEATVLLDLYIDQTGKIRKVAVLKDPGYGFAEAAQKAFEGLVCKPAMAGGKAVAVRFRYPIRFTLK